MIHRVKIYFATLDFEVFGLEMPFLQVLDCHNSPGRAITRHGELQATEGICYSPPTHLGEQTAPKRVVGSFRAVLAFRVGFFLVQSFYENKPLKQKSYLIIF
jgi:hypothetical protein